MISWFSLNNIHVCSEYYTSLTVVTAAIKGVKLLNEALKK